MEKQAKIYIAGHTGMVGSAVVRALKKQGYENILVRTHRELDLERQAETEAFFQQEKPDYVIEAAAMVGGIQANKERPADFLYRNLMINANVMHAAMLTQVKKLIVLGSSCIYPKMATIPIREEELLTGALEPTNEGYAVSKIAALELARYYNEQDGVDFISCMPTNVYGENDSFDPHNSHVIPALIRKFYEAKTSGAKKVVNWGTGTPLREFLYVDDLADAIVFLMNHYDKPQTINVGTGEEISIKELSSLVAEIVGYTGVVEYDTTKPDGTLRKLLDTSRLKRMGWQPTVSLREGLKRSYQYFLEHVVK